MLSFASLRHGLQLVVCLALALAAFHAAGFGQADPAYYRSLMVLVAAAAVFLTRPLANAARTPWGRAVLMLADAAMFMVLAVAVVMFISIAGDVSAGVLMLTTAQVLFGFGAIVILLELSRRAFGWPVIALSVLALVFIIHGRQMPGFLQHRGFSVERTVENLWYSFGGIFGLPSAIILDFVLIFVVFGAVLQGTGAGDRLLKIILALTGRTRGGPAYAAIWSSCLFGTISGSVTANVVGTGTFTIPLTISRGFRRSFAGAVEAVSSAGGQIMPPVMGAAAFLMAALTGVPYIQIALAALVPAVFYYLGIFATVAIEARKQGIEPIPAHERPVLSAADWVHAIQFVGPIIVVVAVLVSGRSPAAAGFYATLTALALALMNPAFRRRPVAALHSIADGGRAGAALLVSAGALGVIIGAMDVSGLGIRFANLVLSVSETHFIGALVMTMLACILLGMGMPTLPAYLVIVLVMGPAIAEFGVPVVAVHLFVIYFGVLSNITPPVAIAAYAAAPIAGADPTRIGLHALRLAFVGFVVPFVFVLEPAMLLIVGDVDPLAFALLCLRMVLCILLVASAFARYDRRPLSIPAAAFRLAIAGVLAFGVHVSLTLTLAAVVVAVAVLVVHRLAEVPGGGLRRRARPADR